MADDRPQGPPNWTPVEPAISGDEDGDHDHDHDGDQEWMDIFPFEQPYGSQRRAINTAIETIEDGGYTQLEGACGTGKTLVGLVAGLHRTSKHGGTVVAATSVISQYEAWENDAREIHQNSRQITAVTARSHVDLNPYVAAGVLDSDASGTRQRVENMREAVEDVIEAEENRPINSTTRFTNAQQALQDIVQNATVSTGEAEPLSGENWMAPYQATIPTTDGGREVDPFYARSRYLERAQRAGSGVGSGVRPVVWGDGRHLGVLDRDRIIRASASDGLDPHRSMRSMLKPANVVICNVSHLFKDNALRMLRRQISFESSVLVLDEAHNVVDRAREELTREASINKFATAERNLDEILGGEADGSEALVEQLEIHGYHAGKLRKLRDLFAATRRWVTNEAYDIAQREVSAAARRDGYTPFTFEQGLRDPKNVEEDRLSLGIRDYGLEETFAEAGDIAGAIQEARREIRDSNDEGMPVNVTPVESIAIAGHVLAGWWREDHLHYFRRLAFDKRGEPDYAPPGELADALEAVDRNELTMGDSEVDDPLNDYWKVTAELCCCLPTDEIADRLRSFHGGIVMSATLSPFDHFETTTGLDDLGDHREVRRETSKLHFPPENRETFVVKAQEYTKDNRGDTPDEAGDYADLEQHQIETREQYLSAITTVITRTPGNVLVTMPTYDEGQWVADELRDRVGRPVLADQSSGSDFTEALLEEFFEGGAENPKVLVTGTFGTLVEGIDYHGERLASVVVAGVPLPNTYSDLMTAIQTAHGHDEMFGGSGYVEAFYIPAVRKVRQAIGRVIRGEREVGTRVLIDERYDQQRGFGHAGGHFPPHGRDEFVSCETEYLDLGLERFWESREHARDEGRCSGS